MAGVSRAAVTKQCRPGGLLAEGCVQDRVDLDAPSVVAWLKNKGGAKPAPPTAGRPTRPKRAKAKPPPPTKRRPSARKSAAPRKANGRRGAKTEPTLLPDLRAYEGLTLRQILERHGTERAFKDLLEARAKIASIQERELDMQSKRGELIQRELVAQFVFGVLDAGLRRILTDAIKTIVRRLYAGCKAGESLEQGEQLGREIITSHIELAKSQAARALANA